MVDPIEIKLDEVDEHVLKTQADVDRLMRDFSKPERGKEMLAQLPTASGGFIDMIVKGIGGKTGGIMGAAMSGGMAAGGIMALVQIIGDAISNSKILMTVLGTIGKALGLLIDVILLPFLPALTIGIIWLFQGIMEFNRIWRGIWASKTMQDIGAGLALVGGFLARGIESLLNIQFAIGEGATAIILKVLKWLWDTISGGGSLTLSIAMILGPAGVLLDWLYNIATGKTTVKATVDFVLGTFGDLLKWLYSVVSAPLKITLDFTSNLAEAMGLGGATTAANTIGGATTAANTIGGAVSDPLGWLGGAMSAIGGAAKSVSSASTIVIQGYTDQKLVQTIENIQRRQNNRYNS